MVAPIIKSIFRAKSPVNVDLLDYELRKQSYSVPFLGIAVSGDNIEIQFEGSDPSTDDIAIVDSIISSHVATEIPEIDYDSLYEEYIYDSYKRNTQINYYNDENKTLLVKSIDISYQGTGRKISSVTTREFDKFGNEIKNITENISINKGKVLSIRRLKL